MYEPLHHCLVVDYYKQIWVKACRLSFLFRSKITKMYKLYFWKQSSTEFQVVNLIPISFKLCSKQKY